MEFTGKEIAEIIAETLTESTQDILDLKNRRPEILFWAELTFDLIEHLVNEEKANLTHPGMNTRGIRSGILTACVEKAKRRKSDE